MARSRIPRVATSRVASVLFLSALTACAVAEPESDLQRSPIVGGEETSAAPATGALTRFGSTHCTATLITPRKAVTAAHCLAGVSASSLRFVLGTRVDSPHTSIQVASVHPHPGFSFNTLQDDIGYVMLAQDAPVAPVTAAQMDASWAGRELLFIGYGASNGFTQTGAGTKRSVRMAIDQVGATQFSYAEPGENTCNGDSGGPAFWIDTFGNLQIVGVTSYGDANCQQYGVDTRVDVYADFLGLGIVDPSDEEPDACGGETFEGRCDGSEVIWCEDDQVKQTNCADSGRACGFSEEHGFYGCVEDPCAGETFEGRCDGNTVIWCENDEVNDLTCSGGCGYDATQGYYNCT